MREMHVMRGMHEMTVLQARGKAGRVAGLCAGLVLAGGLVAGLGTTPAMGLSTVHQARAHRAMAEAGTGSAARCAHPVTHPVGPFTIRRDDRTIQDSRGRVFVTYGITVPGLSSPSFRKDPGSFVRQVVARKDIPKINATARVWCGNTVRLQVSQYDVVTGSSPACDTPFLDQALDREVHKAESDGLVVVINDNTESDPDSTAERDPTQATFEFWNCVTRHAESWRTGVTYAHDPQVIFDVFNEPRADSCRHPHGGPFDMNLWRNGGTGQCGPAVHYQGMDAVVYHLRVFDDTRNLVWVEGPGTGNTLAGLLRGPCPGRSNCLITARLGPVAYAIHHPYVSEPSVPASPATWWKEFGYLIDKRPGHARGVAPVVAGEWTNFSGQNAYCWPDAPVSVPRFLSYLQRLGIGMSAYQLSPPYLIQSNGRWSDTTFYPSPATRVNCGQGIWPKNQIQGPGADIRAWFRARD